MRVAEDEGVVALHGAGRDAADARVRGAGSEGALVLEQLVHEAKVRGDVGFDLLDVFVGAVQRVVAVLHEVGEDDSHRARHAGVAVYQDSLARDSYLLDKLEGLGKKLYHVDVVRVLDSDLFVRQSGGHERVRDA